jgi:NAD(P)-dependent dehydrogenase (short-subunit alcohol dehydrogenase family)
VCPGYVATDMTAGLHGQVAEADMIPATDVAEIVMALTRLSKKAVVPVVPIARPGAHIWRA